MRSLILVVLLVGAAFLGGAFVNGPGLQWAQTRVLKSLGVGAGDEIASVELNRANGDGSEPAKAAKPDPGPIALAPTIIGEDPQPPPKTPAAPARLKKTRLDPPRAETVLKNNDRSSRTFGEIKTSVDRNVLTASLKDTEERFSPPSPAPPREALPPLTPPAGALESAIASPSIPRTGDMSGDWATLVRKMESFGVKRFSVEGEPGGKVVFSCLIPLAGRRAVAQRFEAEDDDLVEAARATLRRIALWRAAQNGTP